MKRGSSAKFQKLGGAMAPAGPLPAPPLPEARFKASDSDDGGADVDEGSITLSELLAVK